MRSDESVSTTPGVAVGYVMGRPNQLLHGFLHRFGYTVSCRYALILDLWIFNGGEWESDCSNKIF